MTDKERYLDNMDAIKRTIESLPDDVTICSIHIHWGGWKRKNYIEIQILQHPDVKGDTREEYEDGSGAWCEKDGEIPVGWVEDSEDE